VKRHSASLVGLVIAILAAVAGCATQGAQRRRSDKQQTARLTLLAAPSAVETARALAKKPYLQLGIDDPVKLLEARASENEEPLPGVRGAAEEALKQARVDYRTFKFTEGVTRLSQAQNRLAAVATSTEDFELLGRLALQRGLCQLALKAEAKADEAIATALLLGHRGPGQGELPPEVETQIKRVRQRLASATTGGITIKARPAGARIWIDGKELGTTPVTAQRPPGLHHVRVTRIGHLPRAFFQRVTPGRMERLEIYLKPAPVPQVARQLLRQPGSLEREVDALRRVLGQDPLLLTVTHTVARAGGSLEARLTGRGSRADRCSGPTPARLADCLGPVLFQLGSGRPYRPSAAAPAQVAAAPVYRRWWFWTLVGAAVAGAGAGTGIYFATRSDPGTNIDLELAK
jgi:hypothetical protein